MKSDLKFYLHHIIYLEREREISVFHSIGWKITLSTFITCESERKIENSQYNHC